MALLWAGLRHGTAFIYEKVYINDGFGPGSKKVAEGRIICIGLNFGGDLMRHLPDWETGLLVRWQPSEYHPGGLLNWEPADWFVRCKDGDGPPHAGIWSTR